MESQTIRSGHSADIMLKLNNDRKTSAKYCDITLIVDEHKYPAHKCVLGLLSPFYDKMFSIEMKERFDNEAVIKGVSKEVFEAILEFVYTSSITLNMENVFGMIEAAHYMDVPYVKECCTEYLGDKVNAENWLEIKAFAKRYDYEELLEKVDERLSEKFDTVISSHIFVKLEVDDLMHLLRLEKRKLESEEKLYTAVIKWINLNVEERTKHFDDLFAYIKFSEMSFDFLTKVVAKEKLIRNSLTSLKLAFTAIGDYTPPAIKTNQSSTNQPAAYFWTLKDFIAVTGKTIFEVSIRGLAKICDFQYNHALGCAVKVGSEIVVIGGINTKAMERLNLLDWQINDCCATVKARYLAAVCNNQLYITGGPSSETSYEVRKHKEFSEWNLKETTVFNRHGHALVSLRGLLYAVGGNPSDSFFCFDPQSNLTKTLPQLNCRRYCLTAVVYQEEIYAIGGILTSKGVESREVERFNIKDQRWEKTARLNVARKRPGACILHNQLVVVGGGSNVVEVYKWGGWEIVGECEELKDVFAIFQSSN